MALGKEELAEFTDEQLRSIKCIEEKINSALRSDHIKGKEVCVKFDYHFHPKIKSEIKKRYGSKGWKIKIKSSGIFEAFVSATQSTTVRLN